MLTTHGTSHLIRRAIDAILDAHAGIAPDIPLVAWTDLTPDHPAGSPSSDARRSPENLPSDRTVP